MLEFVTAIATLVGSLDHLHSTHCSYGQREIIASEWGSLDAVPEGSKCFLPPILASVLPQSIQLDFTHLTELDFQFNDLSRCTPDQMRYYNDCVFIETVWISNPTVTKEMLAALTGFPNLKTIHTRDWFPPDPAHDIDLRTVDIDGVTVVFD